MTSSEVPQTQTQPTIHALLVGIDAYRGRPLFGCVNDVDAMQALLIERAGVAPEDIRCLVSPLSGARRTPARPEEPATLANLRTALAGLAERARPGDRVFIYYSGHGVRVPCAHPAGHTVHREALVPVDFDAAPESRLLFDHEINELLAGIAGAVTCVLDCCHSAGVTRDPGLPDAAARGLDPDADLGWRSPRADPGSGAAAKIGAARTGTGTVDACHVVAACLQHEKALETSDEDGVRHGLLTSALLRALGGIPDAELAAVPWSRIWQAMRATVESRNPWQHLWMAGNPARKVLAGPPVDGDPGLPIRRAGDMYEIDAGTLASVTTSALVAVYGEQPAQLPAPGSREDLPARRGLLRVTSASLGSALAVAEGPPFELPPGARGQIVDPGEAARLRCAILPPNPAIAAALSASPLLEVVDASRARVRLEQAGERWLLTDDLHGNDPARALLVLGPADLPRVRALLEHYYRYALPLRMAESVRDLPGALQLSVLACARQISAKQAQDPDLPEAPTASASAYDVQDRTPVCFRVHNTSDEPLRVTLLNSAASGRVQILGDQVLEASSTHVFWSGSTLGKPFEMTVPQGRERGIDRLTAVGTTELSRELGYLRVDRKFREIFRGPAPAAARKDVGDDDEDADADDPRNNPPVEQWTATQAIITTRAR
jgi:hypothetical protein